MRYGWLPMLGILAAGFAFVFLPTSKIAFATTTTTSTIIGWLVPDGTHWNNGIGALIFPVIGVAMMAAIGKLVDADGAFAVTLILAGLTVGGLLAMLSLNASSSNVLPFALVVIPGADLLFWIWKGEG